MAQRRPIVVVGSINMDLVATTERLPGPGETVAGSSFQALPGGKGANQAVAIARLGYPVRMIGRVGDDSFGDQLCDSLQAAGIDTRAVAKTAGPSGIAAITVAASGENSIVVVPGANNFLLPALLDEYADMIRGAGLVLAQLEIPLKTILSLAKLCADARVPLMLNPAPARTLPEELFRQLAWFTPNETEAAFYSQRGGADSSSRTTAQDLAPQLLARGMAGVVITLGSAGAWLAEIAGATTAIQPFQVNTVDTTGAGDAFNGAFATGLMMNKSAVESAQFASAAAALSVTRSGAQASMATLEEVEALLSKAKRSQRL